MLSATSTTKATDAARNAAPCPAIGMVPVLSEPNASSLR